MHACVVFKAREFDVCQQTRVEIGRAGGKHRGSDSTTYLASHDDRCDARLGGVKKEEQWNLRGEGEQAITRDGFGMEMDERENRGEEEMLMNARRRALQHG